MKWIKQYINTDYKFDMTHNIGILCLIIAISGLFGWFYEFIFYFLNSGMKTFYYRGGNFLPWINIYAYGAILICILTYKKRKKPLKVFLFSALSCGVLELISGYVMTRLNHGVRCWSYNEEIWNFGNIGGYVCLRSVLFFGLSGLLLIYVILPSIFYLARHMKKKTFLIMSIVICSIFIIDEVYNLIFTEILHTPRASSIYKKLGFKYIYFNK